MTRPGPRRALPWERVCYLLSKLAHMRLAHQRGLDRHSIEIALDTLYSSLKIMEVSSMRTKHQLITLALGALVVCGATWGMQAQAQAPHRSAQTTDSATPKTATL